MSRINWWMEYIEGELDSRMKRTMQSLMQRSSRDKKMVDELVTLKEDVRESSPMNVDALGDDYFDALHDKIMASIESRPLPKPGRLRGYWSYRPGLSLPKTPMDWIKSSAALFAFIALTIQLLHSLQKAPTSTKTENILAQGKDSPADFAEMLSYQSGDDFFVDVASRNLDDLSIHQVEELVGKIQ